MFKVSKKDLEEARKRLNLRENRGSDEEYYKHLLDLYEELKPLRQRANAVILQDENLPAPRFEGRRNDVVKPKGY